MLKLPRKISDISILLVGAILITLLLLDGSIFYYKYSYALRPNDASAQKHIKFYLDIYKDNLDKIRKNYTGPALLQQIQSYFDENVVTDAYLLRSEEDGTMIVIAARNRSEIGAKAPVKECNIASSSEILKLSRGGFYFYQEIQPENRVFACGFEPISSNLTLMVKHTLTKGIKGFDDPDFRLWFINNISLTLITTIVGILLVFGAILFFVVQLYKLRKIYEKSQLEYEEKIKQAQTRLFIDPQTGLLNAAAIERDLANYRYPRVLLLDIDDFSSMSQYYGGEICSAVIDELAATLLRLAKEKKMNAYRIAFDRFALLENNQIVALEDYEELAAALLERFKGRIVSIKSKHSAKLQIQVHTTIGISLDDEDTMIKAQIALEYAKNHKKDLVCYFQALSPNKKYSEQITQANIIKDAIINNQVSYTFQPIFDQNKQLLRHEILLRINNSIKHTGTHSLLKVARDIKRYDDLQGLIIRQCKQVFSEHIDCKLSLNLSASDSASQSIAYELFELADAYGKLLWVELIFDTKVDDMARLIAFCQKLKSKGVHIGIDDYGTAGLGALALAQIRPEFIKLDSHISKNVDTDQNSRDIISVMVRLARASGVKIGVKHIYSKEVFEICKNMGADEYQGYYLGAPSNDLNQGKIYAY